MTAVEQRYVPPPEHHPYLGRHLNRVSTRFPCPGGHQVTHFDVYEVYSCGCRRGLPPLQKHRGKR